jgi:N-acetylneuraminate synthase|tara:strand:+ start:963 stop:1805 length:843 start_codon:yes stop_codon:yes gene_type:complete
MKKIFIIGEIGINHNGNIELAKKLILKLKEAGCDAVKFQKRDIDLVYDEETLNSYRESPWGNTTRDQKKGLEFGKKEYDEIDNFCKKIEIKWFASAWDLKSLDFLKNYDLEYNKIASAMIVDLKFLEEVAKEKKYTFISTGMSTMENIKQAVEIFRKYNCPFELMHCISAYPFEDNIANLNLIKILKDSFGCNVGYSGHEKGGLAISCAAAALGITSLERHVTLDRTMYGSDQSASLTPKGFKDLVESVRKIELALKGSTTKTILDIEEPVAKKLRAHIK